MFPLKVLQQCPSNVVAKPQRPAQRPVLQQHGQRGCIGDGRVLDELKCRDMRVQNRRSRSGDGDAWRSGRLYTRLSGVECVGRIGCIVSLVCRAAAQCKRMLVAGMQVLEGVRIVIGPVGAQQACIRAFDRALVALSGKFQ